MSIRPLSNLNTAFSIGIQRATGLQSKYLPQQGRLLCEYSASFSTCAAAGNLFVKSSKVGCRFGYSRKTLLVGASGLLSQSTSRVSEFHCNPCLGRAMAASGPKAAATGDLIADNLISSCGNVSSFTKCSGPSGVHFVGRSHLGSHRASISMRYREPSSSNSSAVHGYFIFDVTRRLCSSNPLGGHCSKNYSSSSSPSYSDGAVPDVSLNASSSDEQFASLSIAADEKCLGDRSLKLQSGSCYLPHPDKEETGGEDAHFICVDEQVIGVADGVGGWADVGVDAGEYARGLMSNSVKAIQDEPKGCIDPARVLTKAHLNTKILGSSTACIIAITDQFQQGIHAINLGDSGFIVIRDGCAVFQSGVQQHGFNFPYQLENGPNGDLPSSGQVFSFPVAPGDVIVAGTDGLFDNLFHSDITAIVVQAVGAGSSPETTAQKIAALARQRALDQTRQTPFSKAAQEAGFRYFGGKLDDVTVVVAYLSNLKDM